MKKTESIQSLIYYTSREKFDQQQKLCAVDPEGNYRATILSDVGGCFHPSVSPDGSKIAFVALLYKDIVIYDVISGEMGNLTQTPERIELHPVWSPFGTTIMFQDASGLWTINCDGTTKKYLHFPHNFSRICEPCYSPDGRGFIFCGQFHFQSRYNPFIRTHRFGSKPGLESSEWHYLIRKGRISSDIYFFEAGKVYPLTAEKDAHLCKFTPEGKNISYVSKGDLWLLNLATRKKENLTENMGFQATNHSWSPDGNKVTIQSVEGDLSEPLKIRHSLIVADINTGKCIELTNSTTHDSSPCWAMVNKLPRVRNSS